MKNKSDEICTAAGKDKGVENFTAAFKEKGGWANEELERTPALHSPAAN